MLALVLLASACEPNVQGRWEAETPSDLEGEPIARGDFAERSECGVGTPTGEGLARLIRTPFLQNVTADAATVLWVGDAVAEVDLVVETPEGEVVAVVPAEPDPGAALEEGLQLRARAEGLDAGETYCWHLRDGAGPLTAPAGLETAPVDMDAPVRFAVWGDSGTGGIDQVQLQAQMDTVDFDLALHVGDLAYPTATREALQDYVFDIYPALFAQVPFFPVPGNHDYSADDAAPFREAFELPVIDDPASGERWYAFDWGSVHFVAMDTEALNEDQLAWLERDLEAHQDAPWIVVYGHHPPYSSGHHGSSSRMRELTETFERHGVDLVFTGHDHHYERTVDLNGVTYVVTGGGGAGTRSASRSEWTARTEVGAHFVMVEATRDRMSMHAIDATGNEFDRAVFHAQR